MTLTFTYLLRLPCRRRYDQADQYAIRSARGNTAKSPSRIGPELQDIYHQRLWPFFVDLLTLAVGFMLLRKSLFSFSYLLSMALLFAKTWTKCFIFRWVTVSTAVFRMLQICEQAFESERSTVLCMQPARKLYLHLYFLLRQERWSRSSCVVSLSKRKWMLVLEEPPRQLSGDPWVVLLNPQMLMVHLHR